MQSRTDCRLEHTNRADRLRHAGLRWRHFAIIVIKGAVTVLVSSMLWRNWEKAIWYSTPLKLPGVLWFVFSFYNFLVLLLATHCYTALWVYYLKVWTYFHFSFLLSIEKPMIWPKTTKGRWFKLKNIWILICIFFFFKLF